MGAALTGNITDDALVSVGQFLVSLFPDCPTILAQENDVPMPEGAFNMINAVSTVRLSTNRRMRPEDQTLAIIQPVKVAVQVDFFGANAQGRQAQFTTLWRDAYAFDWFAQNGYPCRPLYSNDRQFQQFINESLNYEQRWLSEAYLQIDQTIVLNEATAINPGSIGLTEVDGDYPKT